MGKHNTLEILDKISGYTSISELQKKLLISRARAIYLVYFLKKKGYVKTRVDGEGKKLYYISLSNASRGTSYIEVLNKYAPVGLASSHLNKIYGKKITVEETLIYCIKKQDIRHVIACLSLFRYIKNWSLLYKLAKKENCTRKICALYDVAKLVVKKVRRMPKKFKNNSIPSKKDKYQYIVEGFYSSSFWDIEKKWKVYIPLHISDLGEYRGFNT